MLARPRLLLAIALLSVGAALQLVGCGAPERPGTPPEHVLLITLESLRADHCSSFGYPRRTTHILRESKVRALDLDRMAETGVLFANAFAPAADARASLRALLRSSSAPEAFDEIGEPALVGAFGAAGFACAAFVAPSESFAAEARALGFEHVEEFLASPASPDPEHAALDAARAWVAERLAADQRFLLWVHLGRPAPPFDGPPLADEVSHPDGNARQRAIDAYDGELARTNLELCRFLESLQTMDGAPLEHSAVALCGLSGTALPPISDGARLDEAHLHVPLVLRHPASLTGRRILGEVVELADVTPTLLEWFELDAPPALAGRSLLPLVDTYVERPFEQRAALAVEAEGAGASLRTERWRLVTKGQESELFDVERDPEQRAELGAREGEVRAQLLEELRARLNERAGS